MACMQASDSSLPKGASMNHGMQKVAIFDPQNNVQTTGLTYMIGSKYQHIRNRAKICWNYLSAFHCRGTSCDRWHLLG